MIVQQVLKWSIDPDSGWLSIEAVVEDMIELPGTWEDPPEFVSAICEAELLLEDLSDWPSSPSEQLLFLEDCSPTWFLINNEQY